MRHFMGEKLAGVDRIAAHEGGRFESGDPTFLGHLICWPRGNNPYKVRIFVILDCCAIWWACVIITEN